MKRSVMYSVFMILVGGLLAACGRTTEPPVTPTTPKVGDTVLSPEYVNDNLKDYGKWLANTVVNSVRSSGFEDPPTLAGSLMAQQTRDCGFDSKDGWSDQDGDYVQNNYERIFVSCNQDRGGYTEVKNGYFQVQDEDDNNAESGLRSRAQDLTFDFYVPNTGGILEHQLRFQDTWDFALTRTPASTTPSYDLKYALTFVATKVSGGQFGRSWKGVLDVSGSYSPTTDKDLKEILKENDKNYYDNGVIQGASGLMIMDDKAAFAVAFDLEFANTCQATPVAGTLRIDDGTNKLELTFSGCENVTYFYNGVDMAAPAAQ